MTAKPRTRMSAAEYRARFAAAPPSAPRIPGRMNALERDYALDLESREMAGQITAYRFEALTLKLAPNCRYTPDFLVIRPDGSIEFHEVKGHWRDDARVKIRTAAALFPWFRFLAVQRPKGSGAWSVEEFPAA